MTRRERLEARAERRREWAEARERAGDAARQRHHEIADRIPFGQPILVGHHSQRAAEADAGKLESLRGRAVENWAMSRHHAQKADGIERQLRTAIFSDDENAVEQLEAKVAKLEAARDRMKAENASYRKEHAAELRAMSAYERHCAIPYPSYALTNIGARIREAKRRVDEIKRDTATRDSGERGTPRIMSSRYGGTCPDCGENFQKDDVIYWYRVTREAVCRFCGEKAGK